MVQVLGVPPQWAAWVEQAVVVRLADGPGLTRFPALPHAMLAARLANVGARLRLLEAPVFHTLSTQPSAHAHAGPLTAVGLLVRPAAAAQLLGRSTGALVNQALPWALVVGPAEAQRLCEALDGAAHAAEAVQALGFSLQRALAAAAGVSPPVQLCAALADHGAGAAGVLGLSERQLERRCQALLGVAPKTFERLWRFHRTLSAALHGTAPNLAELAQRHRYCDQSHLGRDARQWAGASVRTLLSAAQDDAAWWALAARRLMR